MIQSRRKRWTEHVACMGAHKNAYIFWYEKPEGKRLPDYLKETCIYGRVEVYLHASSI
jgi:hypothetical protein